jgi:hypothetical protein
MLIKNHALFKIKNKQTSCISRNNLLELLNSVRFDDFLAKLTGGGGTGGRCFFVKLFLNSSSLLLDELEFGVRIE